MAAGSEERTTTTPSFAAAAATCVLTRHLILSNLPELKSNLKCILTRSLKDNLSKEGEPSFEDKNAGSKRNLHKSLAFVS